MGEALRKLMEVYEDVCTKTGETPLRLTFDIPTGNAKKLHLKLSPRNLNSSIQLLATYSGMKVSRNKTAYHFEPFADERKQVNKAIAVPPDFASVISNTTMPDWIQVRFHSLKASRIECRSANSSRNRD